MHFGRKNSGNRENTEYHWNDVISQFLAKIFFSKNHKFVFVRKLWFHFNGFLKILFRDTNCTATFWRFWGASCWKSRFPGFELQKMQGSLCLSIFDTINLSAFMISAASVELHTNKKDVWKNILQVWAILPVVCSKQ